MFWEKFCTVNWLITESMLQVVGGSALIPVVPGCRSHEGFPGSVQLGDVNYLYGSAGSGHVLGILMTASLCSHRSRISCRCRQEPECLGLLTMSYEVVIS
jgi:hypothetical protein